MRHLKSLHLVAVLAAALAASACTPLSRTGDQPLSPEELRMRAVETKLGEVNRRINAVEGKEDTKTQDELRNLRGEIERLRFDLDTQIRRSKDVGGDIERRLQKLEAQPAAAPAVDATLATPAVPPVIYAPQTATTDGGSTAAP